MSLKDDIEIVRDVIEIHGSECPNCPDIDRGLAALSRIEAAFDAPCTVKQAIESGKFRNLTREHAPSLALDDGPPNHFPRQPTDGLGWTISLDYMRNLGDSMEQGNRPALEEIEAVLLAIEKLRAEEVERRIKEAGE